jgi:hypothetical protein
LISAGVHEHAMTIGARDDGSEPIGSQYLRPAGRESIHD